MGDPHWQWKSNLRKGLGLISQIGIKGIRPKVFPICLPCTILGSGAACVWNNAGCLKESGLGEPFGKASLANTVSGSSRLVSMTGRDLRGVEG